MNCNPPGVGGREKRNMWLLGWEIYAILIIAVFAGFKVIFSDIIEIISRILFRQHTMRGIHKVWINI